MTPATNLLALLLMVAAADGCDGGPIGTGIVASVSGNVESVTGAAAGTLDAEIAAARCTTACAASPRGR